MSRGLGDVYKRQLLAPMRKDVEEMDRKASEDLAKEDDDGQEGPDCE